MPSVLIQQLDGLDEVDNPNFNSRPSSVLTNAVLPIDLDSGSHGEARFELSHSTQSQARLGSGVTDRAPRRVVNSLAQYRSQRVHGTRRARVPPRRSVPRDLHIPDEARWVAPITICVAPAGQLSVAIPDVMVRLDPYLSDSGMPYAASLFKEYETTMKDVHALELLAYLTSAEAFSDYHVHLAATPQRELRDDQPVLPDSVSDGHVMLEQPTVAALQGDVNSVDGLLQSDSNDPLRDEGAPLERATPVPAVNDVHDDAGTNAHGDGRAPRLRSLWARLRSRLRAAVRKGSLQGPLASSPSPAGGCWPHS